LPYGSNHVEFCPRLGQLHARLQFTATRNRCAEPFPAHTQPISTGWARRCLPPAQYLGWCTDRRSSGSTSRGRIRGNKDGDGYLLRVADHLGHRSAIPVLEDLRKRRQDAAGKLLRGEPIGCSTRRYLPTPAKCCGCHGRPALLVTRWC